MFILAHNGAHVWGGAERSVVLLLAGLRERGHRVLLLCNDPVVAGPARAMGVPTALLPLGGDVAVHHALRLAGLFRRDRPDVLLVGTFKKVWLAGLAARLARVPRVVARIGLESDVPRNVKYRLVFRRLVSHVVVVAERLRPAYDAMPGAAGRVSVVPNGVDARCRREPHGSVRTALGIPPEAPCVGTVARLVTQKRLDRLLSAVARLPGDVHCVIAGEGPCRGALERQARDLGLDGRAHFLGFRDDVGDVLDALDVFVLTSDQEGMSTAMLEALAAGVPVVSTAVSGTEEALRPQPDGTSPGLVVGFDPSDIAAALATILGDTDRRQVMAIAAEQRARDDFSFPRVVDAWEQVLNGSASVR